MESVLIILREGEGYKGFFSWPVFFYNSFINTDYTGFEKGIDNSGAILNFDFGFDVGDFHSSFLFKQSHYHSLTVGKMNAIRFDRIPGEIVKNYIGFTFRF